MVTKRKPLFHSPIALAQVKSFPGQIALNTQCALDAVADARSRGAKLVVFPELMIPSYAAMDLFFQEAYLEENLRALQTLREHSKDICVVVGFADWDKSKSRAGERPLLYNAVALLANQKILHVQRKTLLPNYNIFFDDRYFHSAEHSSVCETPIGKIGCEICEDLWSLDYQLNPSQELKDKGAEIIINSSASPFHVQKLSLRTNIVADTAKRLSLPLLYTNLVGCYDGFEGEVLFDGRSFAVNPLGEVIAIGKFFEEDLLLVDLHGDPVKLQIHLSDEEELGTALIHGIQEYFARLARFTNFPAKAIVGVSGGIDSALVLTLAVEALGAEKVLAVTMPSEFNAQESYEDALLLCKNLGVTCLNIPITESHQLLAKTCADGFGAPLSRPVTAENIQSRVRMLFLMAIANEQNGIVLNTGNKTELALNNCTIYGDMVGGVSVLGDLDKDRVYALAHAVNARFPSPVIPKSTIDRVPTAELRENQRDANVMGEEPAIIAPLVRAIIEDQLSYGEAVHRFHAQFPSDLIRQCYLKIDSAEWKRRQAAPSFRVSPLAFGVGRRIPIGHGWGW